MGLADLASLLKGFKQIKQKLADARHRLAKMETEGHAADQKVVVRVNGQGEVLDIKIDPEAVDPENVEVLEDLVKTAVKNALEKSHKMMKQEMGGVVGGLGIPGAEGLVNLF